MVKGGLVSPHWERASQLWFLSDTAAMMKYGKSELKIYVSTRNELMSRCFWSRRERGGRGALCSFSITGGPFQYTGWGGDTEMQEYKDTEIQKYKRGKCR